MERKIISIYLCVVMIATVFGVAASMNVSVGETNDPSTLPEWHELPNPSGIFLNLLDGVTGPNVAVVWSDARAWGFSTHTGNWHGPVNITGVTEDTAWAAENVVVLRSDTEDWYAFSALTGTWASSGVEPSLVNPALKISKNVALIWEIYGLRTVAFSAVTSMWEPITIIGPLSEYCGAAENIAMIWNGWDEIYAFNALAGVWKKCPIRGLVGEYDEVKCIKPAGGNLAIVWEKERRNFSAFSTLTNQWHSEQVPETPNPQDQPGVKGVLLARNTGIINVGKPRGNEGKTAVCVFNNIDFEWHWKGTPTIAYWLFTYSIAENVALVENGSGENYYIHAFSAFSQNWESIQVSGYMGEHQLDVAKNVGICANERTSKVHGFSALAGYWHPPLSFGGDFMEEKSSANVAMVITDLSFDKYELYGFSATTGSWDIRTINEPLYGYETSDNIALAFNSTKAYAFSANTGHWYMQVGDPHQFDDHYKIAPNVCLVWKLKSEHTDTGYLAYGFSAITSEWEEEPIYDDELNPWDRHRASSNVALVWHNYVQSKAHGFSAITGSWNITDVDGQIDRAGTGGNIAAITTTGNYSYAFDANNCEWYPQYVEGLTILGLSVDDKVAVVWSATHAYAFG